jgi:hypothetical protein
MRRDWVIITGCVGLFLAGFVFSGLIAQFGGTNQLSSNWDSKVDIGTVFNIVAAIATALAAYAAFRSAKIASDAAKDSQSFGRLEILASHQQQFDRLLDDAEKEMRIGFFRRVYLYDRLFPANRNLAESFTANCDSETVEGWVRRYKWIGDVVTLKAPPSPQELHEWMKQCAILANDMNFTLPQLQPGSGEILIEGHINSNFAENPGKPLYFLGEVLHRLATFGLIQQPYPTPINTREHLIFLEAFSEFYVSIGHGETQHRLS